MDSVSFALQILASLCFFHLNLNDQINGLFRRRLSVLGSYGRSRLLYRIFEKKGQNTRDSRFPETSFVFLNFDDFGKRAKERTFFDRE